MNRFNHLLVPILFLFAFSSCDPDEDEPEIAPEIKFESDKAAFESENTSTMEFKVKLDKAGTTSLTVDYETVAISAEEDLDFLANDGTLTFTPGQTVKSIYVQIVVDEFLEGDETFKVVLSNPTNSFLKDNEQEATGTIRNDDTALEINDAGFISADSYPGMNLVWSDEFNSESIDPNNWTYDIGNNGWGNQELQNYTANTDNSYISNEKLVVTALENAPSQYTSARLKSIGLQEYQYGRIDVRAKLPVDAGLWPAIWMLGANFPEVGWPACGEIDIMELVGSNPRRVHGTVHWGPNNGGHQYTGQGISIPFPETFADEFHVFSILWEEDSIQWLLDDEVYYSISPSNMNGQNYPFNQPFFFIINVAVGGQWPGNPTTETTFPEFMAVDYVRVFQ